VIAVRPFAAVAALALAFWAGVARADDPDHDAQVWTQVNATKVVSPNWDLTMEGHSRYTDEVSRVGQILLRPSVTYRLPRGWSATFGYVFVGTRFANAPPSDEHRLWYQVGYTFAQDQATGLLVNGRTRLEQRFRPDADGVGWRLRQQLRVQLPIPKVEKVRALVWNETFVGLNTTGWDRHPGTDQVRTFIGAVLPVRNGVTLEPGYLNQTIFRLGSDRVNHILSVNVFARF
jgi:hypothetical protein